MKDPRPNKRLGQHYLHNPNTLQRMLAEISPAAGECFIEIGPGSGALTLPLAQLLARQQGKLLALEVDERMLPVLDKKLGGLADIAVIHADALQDDLTAIIREQRIRHLRVVGNLPYNISVALIEKFLLLANFGIDPASSAARGYQQLNAEKKQQKARSKSNRAGAKQPGALSGEQEAGKQDEEAEADKRENLRPLAELCISDLHFLVQQEIAQRLFAAVGTSNYGRLAIMTAVLGGGKRLFKVPPGDFYPPPQVTSSFIRISPGLQPEFAAGLDGAVTSARRVRGYQKWQELNNLVTAAFSRPNRKLSNTLANLPGYREALEQTNLSNKRARETAAAEFIALLAAIKA